MPIKSWECPGCMRTVPLDHFETSECGLVVHPDYAAAVLASDSDYYGHGLVTVTSGLGCPRSRAIEQAEQISVNPLDYNALLIGSAWDKHLEQYAPEAARKIRLNGVIEGIKIAGEIDRARRVGTKLIIEDHKHSNNFQQGYVIKEAAPRIEYIIQTSIYAELFAQQFGERPTHGIIWYHFSGANAGKPPLLPKLYSLMPVSDCLDHKPYGGDYTVRELYQQTDSYLRTERLEPFSLPLSGAEMSFGTKGYCDYCSVAKVCAIASKGAPF